MLKVKNLSKTYKDQQLFTLNNINMEVKKREIVVIIGPSGCGKSTLLNIISNNINDYLGNVSFFGNSIGYVFQEDRLLPWKTVIDNIKIVKENNDLEKVNKILKAVEINGFENYLPKNLSGGMRQRCSIARALNYGSDFLLLDEPFKSLDSALRFEMLSLLLKLNSKDGLSILFVTHDIEEALFLADRILVLSKRPSFIKENIKLSEPQKKRNLENEKYKKLKYEILNLLK